MDLDLTKRTLIVVVGVSGSGKSSLVFDTLAAEARRQINSTFSAFAQNFLPAYGRPDVDVMQNLSAAVVVDQRRLVGGARSTVATITDIGDWLRMLYSRASTPHVSPSYAFSFNDPAGMCLSCNVLGQERRLDLEAFLDRSCSLREGPFQHPEYRPRTAHIQGITLPQAYTLQVEDLANRIRSWNLGPLQPMMKEIVTQLDRRTALGLGYLTLERSTSTLSGGEAQRVRMVRHLGSTLNDMLYIFDEHTTGLHARDVQRLAGMLTMLRDQGNTVVVVEHDPAIMAVADQIVEIGPGAGSAGGELVFQGAFEELRRADTVTGRALREAPDPRHDPRQAQGFITIRDASINNLKDVTVDIPLGVLTVLSGVAGSGKSSLIRGHLPLVAPEAVLVDQGPIRGSRRSTPASWTGMLDEIRRLFSRATGQPAGLFSPNSDGGCRACEGTGTTFIDLGFTDPVTTTCETCAGRRFRPGALRHTRNGLNIADVFELTMDDARAHFAGTRLSAMLETACQVGIAYLTLGQSLTTLSGGERQRLRLSKEMSAGTQILVLDEPTTGLHPSDTHRLIEMLHGLTDQGRTVVVVEHDLDVVAAADHVIDMGPEAGHDGGEVQFTGTGQELLQSDTHTGRHLALLLGAVTPYGVG